MRLRYKTLTYGFLIALGFIGLWACSNDKFKVKGEIYGGEDKTLILEKSDYHGNWLVVDSTRINRNGGFSISFPSPMAPDIYRLSLNNQYVYFPVDSKETITVTTSYDNFGKDFELGGSPNAEMMAKFEKELQKVDSSNSDSLANFKRNVYSNYMKDSRGSILSYYILTKTLNGKLLYDPEDNMDRKYFAAVATGFKELRPNDPHTTLLEQTTLQSLRQKNNDEGKVKTIEANEIALIDIDLQNEKGENVRLSDVAGKGKPVVVIFSLLNLENSPALNMELAKIYNRLGGNVEFYNVSLDEDRYAWRDAAKNLPWITVYSPGGEMSQDAVRYNVFQIPSFYIYNSQGELSSRPMTVEELNKKL